MNFPTLLELAAKSVARGIDKEKIPLDFKLDPKTSNLVFRELLNVKRNSLQRLPKLKNHLTITEMDLKEVYINQKNAKNVRDFNSKSLSLGRLQPHFSRFYHTDIVSLLEIILNEETKKGLAHLGMGKVTMFLDGWEEKISQMLPSLQSLDLTARSFSDTFRFSNFCLFFHNLRELDISGTNIRSLEGIWQLHKLEKLVMCHVKIEVSDSYGELSDLRRLKYLDVSCIKSQDHNNVESPMVIAFMLMAEVSMEQLEFLDCSGTSVSQEELETFVGRHSNLDTVVAIDTGEVNSNIAGIRLLHDCDLASLVRTLRYCITMKKFEMMEICLARVADQFNIEDNVRMDVSDIRDCLMILGRVWQGPSKYIHTSFVFSCYVAMFEKGHVKLLSLSEVFDLVQFICSSVATTTKVLTIFEKVVSLIPEGVLIPDALLMFLVKKSLNRSCSRSWDFFKKIFNMMSQDQFLATCEDSELIGCMMELADHNFLRGQYRCYLEILRTLSRYFDQSENCRNLVVNMKEPRLSNLANQFKVLEKQTKRVENGEEAQVEVLKTMMVLSYPMSDEQLGNAYSKGFFKDYMVKRLRDFNNSTASLKDLKDSSVTSKPYLLCSILSLLLSKNLIPHASKANMQIESYFENCHGCSSQWALISKEHLVMALTSEYKTDGTVWWALDTILARLHVDKDFHRTFFFGEGEKELKRIVEGIRSDMSIGEAVRDRANEVLALENYWEDFSS